MSLSELASSFRHCMLDSLHRDYKNDVLSEEEFKAINHEIECLSEQQVLDLSHEHEGDADEATNYMEAIH